jgi:hypothetical protein
MKCATLFDCAAALAEDETALAACAIGRARPPMPSGVHVAHDAPETPRSGDRRASSSGSSGTLRIRFRWRRSDLVLGYLVGGLGFMALGAIAPWLVDYEPLLVIAALLVGVAGLVSFYWALTSMVNHTSVVVGGGRLTVTRAPLPWPKRTLGAADIVQLYCMERTHQDRAPGRGKSSAVRTYDVLAKRRHERDLLLVTELPDPEQALFLEQEIERALGIRDEPVRGEAFSEQS